MHERIAGSIDRHGDWLLGDGSLEFRDRILRNVDVVCHFDLSVVWNIALIGPARVRILLLSDHAVCLSVLEAARLQTTSATG